MTEEKIKEIFAAMEDEEFAQTVIELSPEQAAEKFKAKGVECTAQELFQLAEQIKSCGFTNGELNENELDNVVGGSKLSFCLGLISGAALVALAAFAPW